MSIVTSCIESRKNKILVIYEENGPYSALKTEWIRYIKESIFDFEVLDSERQRLGDSLWQNRALIILSDPQKLNPQWQSDIERYVQTGGEILLPSDTINSYFWPWLHQAQMNNENGFDGGKIIFFNDSTNLSALLNEPLGAMSIQPGQVKTKQAPNNNRFTKITLDADVNEPMELPCYQEVVCCSSNEKVISRYMILRRARPSSCTPLI